MTSPSTTVRNQQLQWAAGRIDVDASGYTSTFERNLFAQPSEETRSEFSKGDGGELGTPGKRGKMQALHSSSALGCNVFEYWRNRDAQPLAEALQLKSSITAINFERKFPTGLPGNAPNLDVVLTLDDASIIAIESKFTEPFGRHISGFKDKYFASEPGLWEQFGYAHCQELARRLNSGDVKFQWLHAEQLLKHILGLAASKTAWKLFYFWYEVPGTESAEHAAEVEEFAREVSADAIEFRSISYQSLFKSMKLCRGESDAAYLEYLGERYFGDSN